MLKRLGRIIGCNDNIFSWHLVGFPYGCLKKNQNAPRPSEHPPVRGEKMSKHLFLTFTVLVGNPRELHVVPYK